LLLSLIGTAAVSLNRPLGTADDIQGFGGYANGYGDVIGSVIRVVGDGWKTAMPSEASCQILSDFCEEGAVVVANTADVGTRGNLEYGELDMTGGTCDGVGLGERDVVESGVGVGVNGRTPNAEKRLSVDMVLVDDDVVATVGCDSNALL
jgi:hypothetical protein